MADPIESLFVELDVRIADLEGKINNAMRQAENAAQRGERRLASIFQGAASASQSLLIPIGLLGGAMIAGGVASIKLAGDMEQSRVAFTTMLGTAEKADEFLKQLFEFASKTPFTFVGLQESAKRMMGMGLAAQDVIPILTAVGDAAAGVGLGQEGINRITLALGQMFAKGKVSGEEMRQLAEAGIPAWQFLADAIGISVPEAMKRSEAGMISAREGIEALVNGINKSNLSGMMAKQAQSINGIFSNLVDNVQGIAITFGETAIKAFDLKGRLQGLVDTVTDLNKTLKASGFEGLLDRVFPERVRGVVLAIAGAIAGALIPGVVALALSFGGLLITLAPFMIAGAAIVLLVRSWVGDWQGLIRVFDSAKNAFSDIIWNLQAVAAYIRKVIDGQVLVESIVDKPWRRVAEVLGSVAKAARDTARFFGNLIDQVRDGITYIKEHKEAELGLAFAISTVGVALTAAAIPIAVSKIAGAIVILQDALLTFRIALLLAQGSFVAFLGSLLPAVGVVALPVAAIVGLGLVLAAFVTDFMGVRTALIEVLTIAAISFIRFKGSVEATIENLKANVLNAFAGMIEGLIGAVSELPIVGGVLVSGLQVAVIGLREAAAASSDSARRAASDADAAAGAIGNLGLSLTGQAVATEEATDATEGFSIANRDALEALFKQQGSLSALQKQQAGLTSELEGTTRASGAASGAFELAAKGADGAAASTKGAGKAAEEAKKGLEQLAQAEEQAAKKAEEAANSFGKMANEMLRVTKGVFESLAAGVGTAVARTSGGFSAFAAVVADLADQMMDSVTGAVSKAQEAVAHSDLAQSARGLADAISTVAPSAQKSGVAVTAMGQQMSGAKDQAHQLRQEVANLTDEERRESDFLQSSYLTTYKAIADILVKTAINVGGLMASTLSMNATAGEMVAALKNGGEALLALARAGSETGNEIVILQDIATELSGKMANLTGTDLQLAGAVMEAVHALIAQAEAAGDNPAALQAIVDAIGVLEPQLGKLASTADEHAKKLSEVAAQYRILGADIGDTTIPISALEERLGMLKHDQEAVAESAKKNVEIMMKAWQEGFEHQNDNFKNWEKTWAGYNSALGSGLVTLEQYAAQQAAILAGGQAQGNATLALANKQAAVRAAMDKLPPGSFTVNLQSLADAVQGTPRQFSINWQNVEANYYIQLQDSLVRGEMPMTWAQYVAQILAERAGPDHDNFATGGVVTERTLAVVGEAEPEIIIPISKLPDLLGQDRSKEMDFKFLGPLHQAPQRQAPRDMGLPPQIETPMQSVVRFVAHLINRDRGEEVNDNFWLGGMVKAAQRFFEGGSVRSFQLGGVIPGTDRAHGDIVPALLRPGEIIASGTSVAAKLLEALSAAETAPIDSMGPLRRIAVVALDDAGIAWLESQQRVYRQRETFRRGEQGTGF